MKTTITRFAIIIYSFVFLTINVNATGNQQLSAQQKCLVSIASYTAQGDIEELSLALNEGLDAGLTVSEINETLVHLYAYCGFPRSLNGISAFMKVLEERSNNGIIDEQGQEIEIHSTVGDRYEKGRQVLEVLTNTPQQKPAPGFGEFSPRIDAFLKEHLFADIFDSDVLSYEQRELVTNAALASMTGVEPQLMAHLNFAMNVGLTEPVLDDMFSVIETTVGKKEAENGRKDLQNVINYRNNNK